MWSDPLSAVFVLQDVLRPLTKLKELSLFRNPEINNTVLKDCMDNCSESVRNLQSLDLRETGVILQEAPARAGQAAQQDGESKS